VHAPPEFWLKGGTVIVQSNIGNTGNQKQGFVRKNLARCNSAAKIIFFAALAGTLCSCSAIVSDDRYPVVFTSTPPGAEVIIEDENGNHKYQDETPFTVFLDAGDGYFDAMDYTAHFQKKCYAPVDKIIDANLDEWYWGNILFGGLIGGLLVDPLTGSMWEINDNVHANLFKIDSSCDEGTSNDKLAQKEIVTKSTGTGFTVSPEGLIVTAYHVIENATSIKVYLRDDTVLDAKVFQIAPSNDLAILKINTQTKNYLSLAPLRTARSGDRVFTVGYPLMHILGQEAKYTEGVISSLSGIQGAASFLQTTVPVQPGNSGGPLINEDGLVVGIISSTAAIKPFLSTSGTLPQSINWAVKADYLRPLIELPGDAPKKISRKESLYKANMSVCMVEAISN